MEADEKIKKLENEIDKLKDSLFEVTSELNYSLYRELAELVRDIYKSINAELKTKKSELTKKEMLNNLKDYLDDFGKNYKFRL
jgi:sugar-specific transcriptional regulator TrmB